MSTKFLKFRSTCLIGSVAEGTKFKFE
eukprot:SAG31_NODE_46820_length_252_cov_199.104575_1_plen_26_part_01